MVCTCSPVLVHRSPVLVHRSPVLVHRRPLITTPSSYLPMACTVGNGVHVSVKLLWSQEDIIIMLTHLGHSLHVMISLYQFT